MECEECDRYDVENRWRAQYKADYGYPEGPIPNPDVSLDLTSRLRSATTAMT
jgi:hypothetical protein